MRGGPTTEVNENEPVVDTDAPSHEMRDRLVRWLYSEYIAMSPEEDERAMREIRRVTRT